MGEGSLKAWGSRRRPSLTLTQVETRAAELIEANLATREIRPDGRAIYRARERSPKPAPVEVVTTLELSPTPPPASVKRARKAPAPEAPPPSITKPRGAGPEAGKCAWCRERRHDVWERADLEEKLATTLAEVDRLASALLSWEQQWGPTGSERVTLASALVRTEGRLAAVELERDQLAAALQKVRAPEPRPADLSPAQTAVLGVLSPDRGTTRGEITRRSGQHYNTVGTALQALLARGLVYQSSPLMWRRGQP
jgi:hypothetical protein